MRALKSLLIVLIGDELLNGSIQDKNAQLLLKKLSKVPNLQVEVQILPDNFDRLSQKIKLALSEFDLIVTSGGLGPTTDDLTIPAVANALGQALKQSPESLKRLEKRYEERGRTITNNSLKQTFFPSSAIIWSNEVGTADACLSTSKEGKQIASFPGVPKEFEFFIEGPFWEWLQSTFAIESSKKILNFRIFGLSEAYVGSIIENTDLNPNIEIAYRPQLPEILLSLKTSSLSLPELTEVRRRVETKIGNEFILNLEEKKSLPETLLELLAANNKTIALAESCTGGRISCELTKIVGSSKSFLGGIVCYSNSSKSDLLEVPNSILSEHGAVSEEVASLLAEKALTKFKSDYAISITGISGPGGGSEKKPIGLIYIGLADKDEVRVFKYNLKWDRSRNQIFGTWIALDLVRRLILGHSLSWEMK